MKPRSLLPLLLVLFVPAASAVGVLPQESRLDALEARFLLRAQPGEVLHVRSEAPVELALVPHEAPVELWNASGTPLAVPEGVAWHGLDGVFDLVVRRSDASSSVVLLVEDSAGEGQWLEWPAMPRNVPLPSWAPGAGALLALQVLRQPVRRARRPGGRRRPLALRQLLVRTLCLAAVRVTDTVIVRASLERVWSWWTDFGEAGEVRRVGHGMGWSRRRIVERGKDHVVFDEEVPMLPRRVTLVRRTVTIEPGDTHRLHESAAGATDFEADWAFSAHEKGTRIVRTVDVDGIWTRVVPRPLARWVVAIDLKHHARQCERDLRRAEGF